jgi:hypothetical protein
MAAPGKAGASAEAIAAGIVIVVIAGVETGTVQVSYEDAP